MAQDRNGRGPIAVADMKARLRAGWTVEMLWERMAEAEAGDGYSYDMAESDAPVEAASRV